MVSRDYEAEQVKMIAAKVQESMNARSGQGAGLMEAEDAGACGGVTETRRAARITAVSAQEVPGLRVGWPGGGGMRAPKFSLGPSSDDGKVTSNTFVKPIVISGEAAFDGGGLSPLSLLSPMSHRVMELGARNLEGYRFDPSEERFIPDQPIIALGQPGLRQSPNIKESISYIKIKEKNLNNKQLAKYITQRGLSNQVK